MRSLRARGRLSENRSVDPEHPCFGASHLSAGRLPSRERRTSPQLRQKSRGANLGARSVLIAGILLLAGCQKSDTRVFIGGTAVTAPGAPPIEDSVIVVSGHTIRAVGKRRDVPVPQDSERTDASGKWIVAANGGR